MVPGQGTIDMWMGSMTVVEGSHLPLGLQLWNVTMGLVGINVSSASLLLTLGPLCLTVNVPQRVKPPAPTVLWTLTLTTSSASLLLALKLLCLTVNIPLTVNLSGMWQMKPPCEPDVT